MCVRHGRPRILVHHSLSARCCRGGNMASIRKHLSNLNPPASPRRPRLLQRVLHISIRAGLQCSSDSPQSKCEPHMCCCNSVGPMGNSARNVQPRRSSLEPFRRFACICTYPWSTIGSYHSILFMQVVDGKGLLQQPCCCWPRVVALAVGRRRFP